MNRLVLSVILGHVITVVIIFVLFAGHPSDGITTALLWHGYLFCWLVERFGPRDALGQGSLCILGMFLSIPIYSIGAYLILWIIGKTRRGPTHAT